VIRKRSLNSKVQQQKRGTKRKRWNQQWQSLIEQNQRRPFPSVNIQTAGDEKGVQMHEQHTETSETGLVTFMFLMEEFSWHF